MGRLRNDCEVELFKKVNAEVIDLFGIDVYLYRQDEGLSDTAVDPLWDEYDPKAKFAEYKIQGLIQEPRRSWDAAEQGLQSEFDAVLWISRRHLELASVPVDRIGEQVRVGDFVKVWVGGDEIYYDIVEINRDGYLNDTDKWMQYECNLKRRAKYEPERKL